MDMNCLGGANLFREPIFQGYFQTDSTGLTRESKTKAQVDF